MATNVDPREYAGRACTLDGESAIVTGGLLPYAYIKTLDGSKQAEFSWPTVARIFAAFPYGPFKS